MSQRQFISNFLGLVIINMLIKATFIFGIDLQVQRQVGQSAYGLYFTLLNLCYIFQIVVDFGLNLLHNTDTAQHGRIRRRHWQIILRIKLFLSFAYVLVVFGVAGLLGFTPSWNLLAWLILNVILISWIGLLRSNISGMGQYRGDSFLSVLDKLLMIIICATLFFTMPFFKIEWFIWAQTASLVVTLIVAIIMSNRQMQRQDQELHQEDNFILVIFKGAIPFCVSILLMFLYNRVDSILLKKLLPDGDHQAGIYAAGFRLLDAANMIAFLVTPLLIPMYSRLQNDIKETRSLMLLAGGLIVFISGSITVAGFWWSEPIMHWLYGETTTQSVETFRWLILAHFPIGLMYVFGTYLTATRELKKANMLYLASVVVNISINLWLIPIFGTVGAAVTAFVTQFFTTMGLLALVQYKLKVAPNYTFLFKVLLFCGILMATGLLLSKGSLHFMIGLALFAVVSIGTALMLKMIDFNKVKLLMRERID
jgi:O-antigen/teichoic acid export membrane protein